MRPIRVANCSGFYGDRLSAAREMVDGGPIDVLTGDWLAELTMLILARQRRRDPNRGYAHTFITQMKEVMADCLERGIRIVSNAGGLSPVGCAQALSEIAGDLGISPVIAWVEGDDLLPRLSEFKAKGISLPHIQTGEPLPERPVIAANAYLGAWGIAKALEMGADIVITGRVTDASLAVGPAAWYYSWGRTNWDCLAGAVVAGHVIECGAQATGGNFSFFQEVPGLDHPGFPIAEIFEDGSSVITKHPGHGGMVTVETVTAQLLYEIGGPRYLNPDVTARFDSIQAEQIGPDRVRIGGVYGEPPPSTAKVAVIYEDGWRSTATLYIAGLEVAEKANLAVRSIADQLPPEVALETHLLRTDRPDPLTNEDALAQLRMTARAQRKDLLSEGFARSVIGLALSTYPGFFVDHVPAVEEFSPYWPAVLPSTELTQLVTINGHRIPVPPTVATTSEQRQLPPPVIPFAEASEELTRVPLGQLFGARSGDKGGDCNLGIWARNEHAYAWIANHLTEDRLKDLLPEVRVLPVERYLLPRLLAVNFVITGVLGQGVSTTSRLDAQGKSLAEWLRSRIIEIPRELIDG